mmetsp:Transcript_33319/g.106317  ORF Transcript_33319/g.106317 Transcript_33319/m.106317 type:complete len:292 (-) Transcript_33319:1047-1922(-)
MQGPGRALCGALQEGVRGQIPRELRNPAGLPPPGRVPARPRHQPGAAIPHRRHLQALELQEDQAAYGRDHVRDRVPPHVLQRGGRRAVERGPARVCAQGVRHHRGHVLSPHRRGHPHGRARAPAGQGQPAQAAHVPREHPDDVCRRATREQARTPEGRGPPRHWVSPREAALHGTLQERARGHAHPARAPRVPVALRAPPRQGHVGGGPVRGHRLRQRAALHGAHEFHLPLAAGPRPARAHGRRGLPPQLRGREHGPQRAAADPPPAPGRVLQVAQRGGERGPRVHPRDDC